MELNLEVRKQMQKDILKLAFDLEKIYPNSNFKHHCYLRIAYDNTVNCKWQNIIKKTFLNNCDDGQLNIVLNYLKLYTLLEGLLLEHNKKSLYYRGIIKKL